MFYLCLLTSTTNNKCLCALSHIVSTSQSKCARCLLVTARGGDRCSTIRSRFWLRQQTSKPRCFVSFLRACFPFPFLPFYAKRVSHGTNGWRSTQANLWERKIGASHFSRSSTAQNGCLRLSLCWFCCACCLYLLYSPSIVVYLQDCVQVDGHCHSLF